MYFTHFRARRIFFPNETAGRLIFRLFMPISVASAPGCLALTLLSTLLQGNSDLSCLSYSSSLCYESYIKQPSLPLHLSFFVFHRLHVYPLDPFLHYTTPPNLIYSNGSKQKKKRERQRGVQNDLLFPEARTSSYCGGHRLSSAPRSEHYSACFNDAQSGRRGRESKIERGKLTQYQRVRDSEKETSVGSGWRWEDWAIFFLPTRLTPTPSPTFPPPLLCRKCTSLSTSILKGSSKLSNLSAILYIIARLNPH